MNTAASAFEELYESAATMVPTGDLVYLPNNPYTPQQLFFLNTAQVLILRLFWFLDISFYVIHSFLPAYYFNILICTQSVKESRLNGYDI
jgi:hypothetical protein